MPERPPLSRRAARDLKCTITTDGQRTDRRRSHNARLIAAAPDLYVAAQAAYERLRAEPDQDRGLVKALASALCKASGLDLGRVVMVDDRAPLYLSDLNKHLPRSKRPYRCRACERDANTKHDSMCEWEQKARLKRRLWWPELGD